MEKLKNIFTSESVSEGHPDKVADQISDAILDEFLRQDPNTKLACETFCTYKKIIISGEVSSFAQVDCAAVARKVITDIGYTKETGLDPNIEIEVLLHKQSQEINKLVTKSKELDETIGAGDQGIMFGYATDETEEYMPISIAIAHKLVHKASQLRKSGSFKWARPDMKSQVSYDYSTKKVFSILMSIQHDPNYNRKEFITYVKNYVVIPVLKKYKKNLDPKILINPKGSFIKGGPQADTGLTGRKIIVDTYGGMARHGGGCFSGKDGSKVDRSAAYTARYIAKNIVAHKYAKRCEVQLSYIIGENKPSSINVVTFGTKRKNATDEIILEYIKREYDLSPASMIKHLRLKEPIFLKTATYGHFGRKDFPWEQIFVPNKSI